jgi:hypothetical protein
MNTQKEQLKKPLYFISINKAQVVRLSAYGVLLLFLGSAIFQAVVGQFSSAGAVGWQSAVLAVVAYFLALGVHELVHGAAFRIFGGHPTYGAGIMFFIPYFFATAGDTFYTLGQMYVIGLSPFILLSVAFLVGAVAFPTLTTYFAVAFMANFSGAVGDLWLMSQLFRFRNCKDVTVVDQKTGMEIYSEDKHVAIIADKLKIISGSKPSFIINWLAASGAILILTIFITFFGSLFQKSLLIGPEQFPLIQYEVTSTGAGVTFNFAVPIVGGFLFALLANLLARYMRNRKE